MVDCGSANTRNAPPAIWWRVVERIIEDVEGIRVKPSVPWLSRGWRRLDAPDVPRQIRQYFRAACSQDDNLLQA